MRTSCWLFCILSILIVNNIGYAGSADLNCTEISGHKNNILDKVAEIKSYQLLAKVKIGGNEVISNISGTIPNRLKVVQEIQYGSEQLSTTVIFDGKFQWVESTTSNQLQVLKIRSSELATEDRPFDTGYYIMGTGLINGEDFLSTIKLLLSQYDLKADCQPGKVIMTGYLNSKEFDKYILERKFQKANAHFKEKFKRNFGFAKITFSYPNYIIQSYSLGTSNAEETIATTFTDLKINPLNIDDEFEYKVPEGTQPIDITDEIKKASSGN